MSEITCLNVYPWVLFLAFSPAQTTVPPGIAISQVSLYTLSSIATIRKMCWAMCDHVGSQVLIFSALLTFPLFLHPSFSLLVCFWASPLPSLLPSGGRGSYNDMGGPVITTQVTIPKDVSKWQQHNMQTGAPKKDWRALLTVYPRVINDIQSDVMIMSSALSHHHVNDI